MRILTGARQLDIHYLEEEVLNSCSDVQIISAEGEYFSTNRLALASCSGLLHKIFAEIEESGLLGTEVELAISTNIPTESLNAVIDFVTRGSLPVATGTSKADAKVDDAVVADLLALGIDLAMLELEVTEFDPRDAQKRAKQRQRKRHEQTIDPSRFVKLDWDILGAALESIGGLDPNNPTAVEVVSAEGESQQIIIQPGEGGIGYQAQIGEPGADVGHFLDGESRKRGPEEYAAGSAKMRRIMLSKLLPTKRPGSDAAEAGSSKPRGRPRKSEALGSMGPMIRVIKVEDENGDYSSSRRYTKKPKRYDGPDGDDVDDDGFETLESYVREHSTPSKRKSKSGLVKPKRARAPKEKAADSSVRWVTCVACGKICKNNYLFKIHLKNFGPYHNNSCALCHAVFDTWEQHIAHLRERHNGEYKYKCGICPEIFETEERQRIHRHEIHTRKNKDKTACDKCGKIVIDYAAHQENFHGTEEHPCPHCGRMFGHAMALKRHIKDNHRQFPCEHCGNIMKNFKKYRLHILSVHTPDNLKPYQCQICVPSRGFATKWNLFEHMNKHTNERPFKCRNCPSAFATTSSRCHHEKSCCGTKNIRIMK